MGLRAVARKVRRVPGPRLPAAQVPRAAADATGRLRSTDADAEGGVNVTREDVEHAQREATELGTWEARRFAEQLLQVFRKQNVERAEVRLDRAFPGRRELIGDLLHEPPALSGFNRTAWRISDLREALLRQNISENMFFMFFERKFYALTIFDARVQSEGFFDFYIWD